MSDDNIGMGNLMLYNNTFTISEELELFDKSIRLVEDFWKFQEQNHEIVIPDSNLFKTKVPELYHYKLWGWKFKKNSFKIS